MVDICLDFSFQCLFTFRRKITSKWGKAPVIIIFLGRGEGDQRILVVHDKIYLRPPNLPKAL